MYKLALFLGICSAFALGSKLPVPVKKSEKVIACYYEIWAEFFPEPPQERLITEDIDASLCTHLYYNNVGLNADASVKIFSPNREITEEGFKKFNDLRQKNPQLKTLFSMGGSEANSVNYTKVVSDPILREKLANNVVEFVKKYEFNGIDIFWEYPAQRNEDQVGIPSDKQNFVLLLKALRNKFDKKGLILSVTVGNSEATAKISYDIKGISMYVNFINLMTYNFHSIYDTNNKVGHNTPIYPSSKENAEERKLNIDHIVNYWLSHGAPPSKLILGTAFYGNAYTLANPKHIGRGAPFSNAGLIGMPAFASSMPAYYDICPLAKNKKWKHIYDKEQQVSYIYKGDQIIAYDDVESIKKKAEYAKKMNLGGVFVWSIDQDDFNGDCGENYPLLKTLNRILRNKW